MYAKQLYSSSGRIRKIILFDTKFYALPEKKEIHDRFAEIRNKHLSLINGMHVLNNEIWFYIFYNKTNSSKCSGIYEDRSIKTKYIAVNECIDKLYVPTRWTQNVLLVGPGQSLMYDNNHVSHALAEIVGHHAGMQRVLPLYNDRNGLLGNDNCIKVPGYEDGDRICGGEILVGRVEQTEDRFLLHGLNTERVEKIKKEMFKLFELDEIKYFKHVQSLDNAFTREYSKSFYHLDYFCMLAGYLPRFKQEGVFVSVPYVFIPGMYRDTNRNAWPETKPFTRPPVPFPMNYNTSLNDPQNIDFRAIELPMYIFPKEKDAVVSPDNIALVLSYANCIVENFRLRSWKKCNHADNDSDRKNCKICSSNRSINVYFPDYRNAMSSYIARAYQDNDQLLDLQGFFENQKFGFDTIHESNWKSRRDAFRSMHRFFDRVHLYIRNKLAQHDIPNVQFVSHDFFTLAQSGGSLHCIAKVVERDMVN